MLRNQVQENLQLFILSGVQRLNWELSAFWVYIEGQGLVAHTLSGFAEAGITCEDVDDYP